MSKKYDNITLNFHQKNYIRCTLRSGLHEILTMNRTYPHGLENKHGYKWISDNFPGMLINVLFLENCQKTICMHASMWTSP